jgi:hypothetical protein
LLCGAQALVGWVERSDTHHDHDQYPTPVGYHSTPPKLRKINYPINKLPNYKDTSICRLLKPHFLVLLAAIISAITLGAYEIFTNFAVVVYHRIKLAN